MEKPLKESNLLLFLGAMAISILHVFVSINVRENPSNPLFWAYIACGIMGWKESCIFPPMIGVLAQSLITTISFANIMKWKSWKIWLYAEVICLSITALVPENECWYYLETHKWYKDADNFLGQLYGGAILYYLLLYLFIQVLYICLYSMLRKILHRAHKR